MIQKVHVVRNTSGGFTIWHLLTLMFVGLKLTGEIQWSWWEVFIPMFIWLPVAVIWGLANELKGSKR